jgi:hypothetical protein
MRKIKIDTMINLTLSIINIILLLILLLDDIYEC